jgi:2-polyprenyl-6-methoxyphenol hydroxylase-like FAD-dependent oxidoreductase
MVLRAPFLGQGANQAVQDAFCLTSLIYEYNHGESYELCERIRAWKSIPVLDIHLPRAAALLNWLLDCGPRQLVLYPSLAIVSWCFTSLLKLSQVRVKRPNKLQRMMYEYENLRKAHNAWLTVLARIMGYAETLGGSWGFLLKCGIFRTLEWTGLGKNLFLAPIKPVV